MRLKTLTLSVVVLTALGWWLDARRDVEFERAVDRARLAGADRLPSTGQGLPWFLPGTLTPTWSVADLRVTIPRFSLLDQHGRRRDETLFDGSATFVAFFFTSCGGVCPTLISHLQAIESAVPQARFVALSVDPEKDTPARLVEYARRRGLSENPRWTFLTGDRPTIYSLAGNTLGAEAFRRPGKDSILHTEHFYLVDGERRLRAVLNGTRLDVVEDAKRLVASGGLP